jgi:hypothetical protein
MRLQLLSFTILPKGWRTLDLEFGKLEASYQKLDRTLPPLALLSCQERHGTIQN